VVLNIGKDRGLNEIALFSMALTAVNELGALLLARI